MQCEKLTSSELHAARASLWRAQSRRSFRLADPRGKSEGNVTISASECNTAFILAAILESGSEEYDLFTKSPTIAQFHIIQCYLTVDDDPFIVRKLHTTSCTTGCMNSTMYTLHGPYLYAENEFAFNE